MNVLRAMASTPVVMVLGLVVLFGSGAAAVLAQPTETTPADASAARRLKCPPLPDASEFVDTIDNPYLPLIPGTVMVYRGEEDGEEQKNTVEVTRNTKTILGVTTTVILDTVRDDKGDLVEKTRDWHAQDKDGNVWYFGEDSRDYENNKVVSTKGSWEAGVKGAKPGIVMYANPRLGERYYQECAPGVAEDQAEVLDQNETVTVPYGSFRNVLLTKDYSPFDPGVIEHKYYARCVGNVRTVKTKGGEAESVLVEVKRAPGGNGARCGT